MCVSPFSLASAGNTSCDKGPSTLATLFNHMWPRIVAGIFIPVGNHYFQALTSTLQFVAQVCDRLWLVPATDRAFAYITYMSPPHVALVCSGPPQCAATCGWTKWPVCSGPNNILSPSCPSPHSLCKWLPALATLCYIYRKPVYHTSLFHEHNIELNLSIDIKTIDGSR